MLAISLVVHVKTRYRLQALPVFYLWSAVMVARPGGLPAGAARLAPAVCAAVLLLAFGGPWLP